MNPFVILRIGAAVAFLLFAGHTLGAPWAPGSDSAAAVVETVLRNVIVLLLSGFDLAKAIGGPVVPDHAVTPILSLTAHAACKGRRRLTSRALGSAPMPRPCSARRTVLAHAQPRAAMVVGISTLAYPSKRKKQRDSLAAGHCGHATRH